MTATAMLQPPTPSSPPNLSLVPPLATSSGIKGTPQQEAFWREIIEGKTHIVLSARAGSGKKALLKGRDISKPILELMDTLGATNVQEMGDLLKRYRAVEVERLTDANKSAQVITAFEDKCETLEVLMEGCSFRSQIEEKIDRIFKQQDPKGAVILTSAHSSKGLEADTVWILAQELMPHPAVVKKGRADELEQEDNLKYVAFTRSMRRLIFIEKDGKTKEEPTPEQPQPMVAEAVVTEAIVEELVSGSPVIETPETIALPSWQERARDLLNQVFELLPYDAPHEIYCALQQTLEAIPRD